MSFVYSPMCWIPGALCSSKKVSTWFLPEISAGAQWCRSCKIIKWDKKSNNCLEKLGQLWKIERLLLPCSGNDSAITNLQSGSFLSAKGSAMPALLHFQYSMAVRRSPMPSWFMTKPSSLSSLLLTRTNNQLYECIQVRQKRQYEIYWNVFLI